MSTDVMEFTEADAPDKLREPKLIAKSKCHVVIVGMEDLVSNQTQDVYGFEITMQIVGSDVAGQEGKTFHDKFGEASPSHKDGGEYCMKRRKALVLATGLIPLPPSGKVPIPYGQLVDMQFVCEVDQEPWQTDKSKFNNVIRGCNMWHIDEPAAANVPRNQMIIDQMAGHRWTPEMIQTALANAEAASKAKGKGKNGSAGAGAGVTGTAAGGDAGAGANTQKPDFSNL